jgi:hypothetical protein
LNLFKNLDVVDGLVARTRGADRWSVVRHHAHTLCSAKQRETIVWSAMLPRFCFQRNRAIYGIGTDHCSGTQSEERENAQCDSVGMQLVARFIRGVHHHACAGRARVRQPSTWVARKTQVTQCNTPGPFVQIIVVVPRDLAIVESPPICASRGVVVGGVPTVQKGSHVLFEEGARCGPVEVLGCALRHACILRQCCASDMHGRHSWKQWACE